MSWARKGAVFTWNQLARSMIDTIKIQMTKTNRTGAATICAPLLFTQTSLADVVSYTTEDFGSADIRATSDLR